MQWTPYDVKVMEHTLRIERANRPGWMTDPSRPQSTADGAHIRQRLTAGVMTVMTRLHTMAAAHARSAQQHA